MDAAFPDPASARRMPARALVVVLRAAQVLLSLSLVAMATIALLLMLDGSVIRTAFDTLVEDGGAAPPYGSLALACLAAAVIAAAWIWVLQMLVKVIRTVQAGDPFQTENIGRLRAMWVTIAVTELFRMAIHAVADISVASNTVAPADTGLDIRIGTWFLVLVLAALSEAFRHGAAMRRDQELTI